MDVIALVLLVALVAAVALVVSAPLRRELRAPNGSSQATDRSAAEADARPELEQQREAKYREIRDAELDYRTGKLSESDYTALDSTLRAEAMDILRRLDALD
ncbi:MAG TPA: hypothetical protein VGN69_10165 [Solirubrobacteraceae bacterium]|nr:hypothetical protein [Solirubrobacteraceae bacterium]